MIRQSFAHFRFGGQAMTNKRSYSFKVIHKLFLLIFLLFLVTVSSGGFIYVFNERVTVQFQDLKEIDQVQEDYNRYINSISLIALTNYQLITSGYSKASVTTLNEKLTEANELFLKISPYLI